MYYYFNATNEDRDKSEKLAQALDTFSNEPAEDLDVEKIKGLFIENGYTFDIH